jgi:hypothetical protein
MTRLFRIKDYKVEPTPQALLVHEVQDVWKQRGKKRDTILDECAYVEFMVNPRSENPFYEYEELKRDDKLRERYLGGKEPHDKLVNLIEFYRKQMEEESATLNLYDTILTQARELTEYLKGVDLKQLDDLGKPIHDPSKHIKTLKEASTLLPMLSELKKKVESELYERIRTTKDLEIGPYEE